MWSYPRHVVLKQRVTLAGTVLLVGCARPSVLRPAPAAGALALQGVTIVDVADGRRRPEQTVLIVGNRIRQMGPSRLVRIPPGAQVVEAQGRYLIPGLWDMHVHVIRGGPRSYALFLAYGITGVRDMLQPYPIDSIRQWRSEIAAGTRAGPRVLTPGPYLMNAEEARERERSGTINGIGVGTPEEGRRAVDSLQAAGADFIKVHDDRMAREVFFAIAAEARRVGLPLTGHWTELVTVAEAVDSGQRSFEHVATPCPPDTDAASQQECRALVERLVRHGAWLTPTLVAGQEGTQLPRFRAAGGRLPILAGTDFALGREYLGTNKGLPLSAAQDSAETQATLEQSAVKMADWSVHQELARFVEAGLTPAEALQTATLNPAQYLGATDSLGTIAAGKLADLVLLDADPLADVHNTTKIRAVVANGRYFDRMALDALLAPARGAVQKDANRRP